ncbi:transposase [Denitrificimonas sp. JX-1]|uniref:Transposase n=1 Tax=Denitrificimonas halotolerans TaxID=3098930 RepID=A0ABU5GSP0_9GAMM|nr:transposase [Denitrificimonas sp. JX-1]MDY7219814.1 transposase [Denitrificimonas sp. JX-1]
MKVSAVRHKCAFGLFAQLSLILVTKYRWKIFDAVVSSRAKKIFDRIAPHYKIECIEWSHDKDHVHILFKRLLLPTAQSNYLRWGMLKLGLIARTKVTRYQEHRPATTFPVYWLKLLPHHYSKPTAI